MAPTLGSYVWLLPGPSQSSESCMTAAPTRTRGGAHCHCLIFTKNTSTPIRTSVTHMKELRIKLKITKIYGDAGHDQRSHLSPFLGYLLVLFSAVCSDARQGVKMSSPAELSCLGAIIQLALCDKTYAVRSAIT